MTEQEKNFKWYLDNQERLVEKYNGRHIVIHECEIISLGDRYETYHVMLHNDLLGRAIMQKVSPGDVDYTVRFHNDNVSFKEKTADH